MDAPGTEYAAFGESGPRRSAEAVRSLARFLGVTETRAAGLLSDPSAYAAEIRSRNAAACPCGCGLSAAEIARMPL